METSRLTPADSVKIDFLERVASRHLDESNGFTEKSLKFPVVDGVRPVINNYSRLPGSSKSTGANIVAGGISLIDWGGTPAVNLFRTDGGQLSRPYSATGFGDMSPNDPRAGVVSAVIHPDGVKVLVGGEPLGEHSHRAAEHFARVLLTFLTRHR